MNLKALILSDLHINFSGLDIPQTGYDLAVVAGDLSPHTSEIIQFFQRKLADAPLVIYVTGNHEYEGKNIYTYDEKLKHELARHCPNVRLLQNESLEYQGTRFLGTTLWSNFELLSPDFSADDAMEYAKRNICDYNSIIGQKGLLKPEETLSKHHQAVEFLNTKFSMQHDGPTMVITHFPVVRESINPKYEDNPLNSYFCSDYPELMGHADYWVHGHTHDSFDYVKEGTRVICNPRGYSQTFGLTENNLFNANLILELTPGINRKFKKISVKP